MYRLDCLSRGGGILLAVKVARNYSCMASP